jgi:thymidylate synthase
MYNYLNLMSDILLKGNVRDDRTGVGTKGLFNASLRYDLREGFPLVTTKKVYFKGIVHELLWFLKGDTNTQYLLDNDVHIWDGWALNQEYLDGFDSYPSEVIKAGLVALGKNPNVVPSITQYATDKFIEKVGYKYVNLGGKATKIFDNYNEYVRKIVLDKYPELTDTYLPHPPVNSLGPVYGKMFRAYPTVDHLGNVIEIDQLTEVVKQLKEKPFSRRHIVNLWHPGLAPDESITPKANVLIGKQALAPCHFLLQFYVNKVDDKDALQYYVRHLHVIGDPLPTSEEQLTLAKAAGWRNYQLSLAFTMRSSDVFLGLPFNIASYALLLMIIANQLDYQPVELVYNGGDVHLYHNQIEAAKLQLNRSPRKLPNVKLNVPIGTAFDSVKYEDIELLDYVSYPAIKVEVAV